jgi:3-oxoacyl-[acyl-carrier protein] reductase
MMMPPECYLDNLFASRVTFQTAEFSPLTNLKNKVALVTGAGRGIGKAIALDLAREGCHVAVTARNAAALAGVVREARKLGVKAIEIALDLAEEKNIGRIVDDTVAALGPIDFLVNNAAVLIPAQMTDVTLADWDHTMTVNLRSVFLLSQRVLRQMIERRTGYIVNISSTVAHGVKQEVAAYGVSKCGLVGLSQALYAAGKPFGVRVSTVYPGVTDTPMLRSHNEGNAVGTPDLWMLPEDISYCVLFLLKQSPRMVVKEITPWAVQYDRI